MRRVLFFLAISTFVVSSEAKTKYFTHTAKKGEWVAQILRSYGATRPWTVQSWTDRLVRWNPFLLKEGDQKIPSNSNVFVPVNVLPPGLWSKKRFFKVKVKDEVSIANFLKKFGINDIETKVSWVERVHKLNPDVVNDPEKTLPLGAKIKIPFDVWPMFPKIPDYKINKPAFLTWKEPAKPKKIETIKVDNRSFRLPASEASFNVNYEDFERPVEYKNHHLKLGTVYSLRRFSKTELIDAEFNTLSVYVNYRNLIAPPFWQIDLDASYTVNATGTTSETADIGFLDINLRAGLALPWIQEPYRLTLLAGIYVTDVFLEDPLGFGTVGFLQFYPELRRIFSNGDSISLYGRFAPTSQNPFTFKSNENATLVGIRWTRTRWRQPLMVGIEYSSLRFVSRTTGRQIDSYSTSLMLGVGF